MPGNGSASVDPSIDRATLPTGTVTFLFSDIEGSTKRWDTHRQAMRDAVNRHDTVMRTTVEQHNGKVFKTVGDGFCCVFASACDALDAALMTQRSLANEDFSAVDGLRVRMGLHSGISDERDADYFGPAVNRVARLMAIGHGGQVLVSAATHELVQEDVRAEVSFIDLGMHRLKDLAQPERVWQVSASGLKTDFPPLRSLDTMPNNLPLQVTNFYGREHEIEHLKSHLKSHRLVTLRGAGGVGKTRLAAQVGAELLDEFADGVWIADLAPISEPESVPSVVAQTLGVNQSQGGLTNDLIARWLKDKHVLLVLDNCEHVLQTAAELADAVHRHCPNVRLIVTSRQPLGVTGEKVTRVDSLGVPQRSAGLDPDTAKRFAAIALFADRASLVNDAFCLDCDNVQLVSDICQRLDGIPLAIELAAARTKVLSISNLAHRLNERFRILTGGSRTNLPRQQTLKALIDWSYDLLSPQERLTFNRSAIFACSFTLDAAIAVCGGPDLAEEDVLDLLASLADKSLLVVDTSGEETRYRLLESTREYALEKLQETGDREKLAHRHARYFMTAAQKAEINFGTVPLNKWLALIEEEMENFRSALEWSLGREQDAAIGAEISNSLQMFWWHAGREAEGRYWIERALNQIDEGEQRQIAARLRQALSLLTSRLLFS